MRHLEHADVPAHNNYLENLIRPFSQGRRVWLFANNPLGVTASANLYSLVATARANGLEPGWQADARRRNPLKLVAGA